MTKLSKCVRAAFSIFFIFVFANSASARLSAHRDSSKSFTTYLPPLSPMQDIDSGTPVSTAARLEQLRIETLPELGTLDEMTAAFRHVRDIKFLNDPNGSSPKRRSSWLYPDDGCFARAALANANLEALHAKVPYKIFIFGDLVAQTPNSPNRYVTWWYHVVPAYRLQNEAYVLDPAIDPSAPLKLKDWIAKISTQDVTLAICGSGTYGPSSDCSDMMASRNPGTQDQSIYLTEERYRLEDLGRDADAELGESPPWLESVSKLLFPGT